MNYTNIRLKYAYKRVVKFNMCVFVYLFLQMFEPPVTFVESKKQKTLFEDTDGSKVIAYLEKDSPGSYKLTMSP